MTSFTDEDINKIIERHLHRQEYQREYYKNKYQNDPEHKEKKKQRSKEYYASHKKQSQSKYELEGDYQRAKRRYDYAKKNNSIEKFKLKYPNDYETWFKED